MADKKKNNYLMYYLIGIIVIVVIILFYVFINISVNVKANVKLRCSDSTVYDTCSYNKPYYCSNGTLLNNPLKCGCPDGMMIANGVCKNISDLIPGTNFNCSDLVPKELSVKFSLDGLPQVLSDFYNKLTNNNPLSNDPSKSCFRHAKATPGENINVESLFYCYGTSDGGGEVKNNIVSKSYIISYQFTMDSKTCNNVSVTGVDVIKKCSLNQISCSWKYSD